MKRGITRRWIVNGFGVIAILLVIFEVTFALVIRSYYYQNVESSLFSRANSLSTLFSQYTGDAYFDFETTAQDVVESFNDKEKIELQMVDKNGLVFLSSTGFAPSASDAQDFWMAAASADKKGVWRGTSPSDEHLMAMSMLVTGNDGTVYGAVRYVVSLTLIDRQILIMIAIMLMVGLVVLFFVMLSSSYFVSTIVNPIKEIGEAARNIAMGDYNSRIEKKYDDEIGDLCDTINHMAGEISKAEDMKNDFISSVSHELRTPLTAITGWSETLKQSGNDPELMAKGLDVISGEAIRLSGIVEELLDFSRVQSGRFQMKMVPLDVLADLDKTVLLFRERAQREGMELRYNRCDSLPPVMGDGDRLRQVLINVMDNAIKYSNPGGIIYVSAAEKEGVVQIMVTDNGVGISKQDLPNVKARFFRANRNRPGSGIGLALADDIVKDHGGTLDIASEEGIGTAVTITLPVSDAPTESGGTPLPPH